MQRNNTDCAICCISLATGHSYDFVMSKAGENYDLKRGTTNARAILDALHVPNREIRGRQEVRQRSLVSFLSEYHALTGRPQCHMMYYDGEEYHDPANNPVEWKEIYRIIELC